jgi:glycosyltransferase involved in cell wall biosynthesis
MHKNKIMPISVIIASLGGDSLFKTLHSINSGLYRPKEIIVSLPPKTKIKINKKYQNSIKIVNSINKGQVTQRSFGFKFCTQDYVMQADDDIIFQNDTIFYLYKNIKQLGKKNVVGPIYKSIKFNKNITEIKTGLSGFLISLYHKFICMAPWSAKRMGYLTKIGLGYGVDPSQLKSTEPFEVTWLNGGCVMCHKEDLILENYFPFEGKAYFEDTIHAILWLKNKNRLWVLPESICFLEQYNYLMDDLNSYIERFKIHKFVVKMLNGNFVLLYIWKLLFLIKFMFLRIFKNVKN